MKNHLRIAFFLIIPLLLSGISYFFFNTVGCTKTVTEVVQDTTSKNIVKCILSATESMIYFYCDPIEDPETIDAYKRWDSDSSAFTMKYTSYCSVILVDTSANNIGTEYTINLSSDLGNTQGSIIVPESTYIIQPAEEESLPLADVTVSWSESQYADFYLLYFSVLAYDSSSSFVKEISRDTFLTGLSFIIPSSFFDIDSAYFIHGNCIVTPHSGPLPTSGTPGNMSGTLDGFIIGKGHYDDVSFYVETPPPGLKTPITKKELSFDEIMASYLRALCIN